MSDPRSGMSRDKHIEKSGSWEMPSDAGGGTDTSSATTYSDPTLREAMQQELMDLGRWLLEHPEAKKNLKPVRGSVVLKPGVYHNTGTGMIERIYTQQHVALGARWFRIKKDPAAPVEEIRRRVLEGK